MIDIETLDSNPTASIVQIGVVDETMTGFCRSINIDDALKHGTVSGDTLHWWMRQSDDARYNVFDNQIGFGLKSSLEKLNKFIVENQITHLWSHASFDIPILVNAFRQVGITPEWDFRNLRDLRTIEHFYGDDIEWEKREGVHHNALDDAEYQMIHLKKMLELSEKG